ncbi:MAG: hypothetical protein CL521_04420 [Actinobacteria bacterium]|nr:hypothetical protein [Actinomycetota bacterium]
MKLVDRYIIKELISPFFFGIIAFSFIISGSTILFQLIGEAVKYNIPIVDLIRLFFLKLPYIIALSFPMSTLLSTILVFGRLGNDLELLAFRAGGVSVLRLVVPIIVVGFSVSCLTVLFNESIVPKTAQSAEYLFRSYRDKQNHTIKKNVNLTEFEHNLPKRIINVREINQGIMRNITVAEFDSGQLARIIRAKRGEWLPEGGWIFFDGLMHHFSILDPKKITLLKFKKEQINITLSPLDLTKRPKKIEEMTRQDLKDKIDLQKKLGEDPIKDIMDYHLKLSVAFASLIYSILGASVGLRPHRSSSAIGLGLSLMIILVYIVLLGIGTGLGLSHILPPIIAAWFPNIIVGIAGVTLLTFVK